MEQHTGDLFAGKDPGDVKVVGYRGQGRRGRPWRFAGINIVKISMDIHGATSSMALILKQQI